jgi:hypothetical protein
MKPKFTTIYSCRTQRVEYGDKTYLLCDEWDDISSSGDVSITDEDGTPVDDETYKLIRDFWNKN